MNWIEIKGATYYDADDYESPCKRFRIRSYNGEVWLPGIRIGNSDDYRFLTPDESTHLRRLTKEELMEWVDNTPLIMHDFEYVFGVAHLQYSERFAKGLTFVDIPYNERVSKGMRLLDKEMPGWESNINIDTLDMSKLWNNSIMGQLAKAKRGNYKSSTYDIGDIQCELSVLTEDTHWYGLSNYYDDRPDANDKLTEAWKNAILIRKNTYPKSNG